MIYLVRHGLDDESYVGGHSDIDLVDEGIIEVKELGIWLKQQDFDVNRIYTSDIKRAVSTSNIINSYLDLPVTKTRELRELDKGCLTGLKKGIAKVSYPDYIEINDINTRYPGGESMLDLYLRIKRLLLEFSKYDESLVVTHRGVINMIYCLLNGDSLDMNKERYNVEHASVHELDLTKSRVRRIR